ISFSMQTLTPTLSRRTGRGTRLLHPHHFSPTFPLVTAECILACVYFFLGPFVWGFLGFGIINGRGKMEILKRPSSPVPQPAPRVAVLIPAKDEAGQIEKCVSSVLAQD